MAWRRGLLRDYTGFIRAFHRVVRLLEVIRLGPGDLEGVGEVARETGLTFYDAAYVYTARSQGMVLVTEDREILASAPDVAVSLTQAQGGARGSE